MFFLFKQTDEENICCGIVIKKSTRKEVTWDFSSVILLWNDIQLCLTSVEEDLGFCHRASSQLKCPWARQSNQHKLQGSRLV